ARQPTQPTQPTQPRKATEPNLAANTRPPGLSCRCASWPLLPLERGGLTRRTVAGDGGRPGAGRAIPRPRAATNPATRQDLCPGQGRNRRPAATRTARPTVGAAYFPWQ